MTQGTLTPTGRRTICPRCGHSVLQLLDRMLDPEPVVGGCYQLVGLGTRLRRPWDMAEEFRAGTKVHGGGYDLHRCPDREDSWADR